MIRTITSVGLVHERIARQAVRQACSVAARIAAAGWTFEHHYRQLLDVFAEAGQLWDGSPEPS